MPSTLGTIASSLKPFPVVNFSVIPDSAISAWFKFQDNLLSSKGSYSGTAFGGTYNTGKAGKAAFFNGTNNSVALSFQTFNMVSGTSLGNRSYSMWLRPTSNSQATALYQGGGGTVDIGTLTSGSNVNFSVRIRWSNSTWRTLTSPSSYTINNWYHVALTVSSFFREAYLYVNGSLVLTHTLPATGGILDRDNPFYPGYYGMRKNDSNSSVEENFWSGGIDEVGFFTAYLSDTQVGHLYNSGKGRTYP